LHGGTFIERALKIDILCVFLHGAAGNRYGRSLKKFLSAIQQSAMHSLTSECQVNDATFKVPVGVCVSDDFDLFTAPV
jgi:hypothetical protein